MYVGKDFTPIETEEARTLGFNFVNFLRPNEILQSATWSVSVLRGSDSNPSSHLLGPPRLITPDGTTLQTGTVQGFGGFLTEVTYILRAIVNTNQGNTHSYFSHIYCGAVV